MIVLQQCSMVDFSFSSGRGIMQMGQSPKWLLSGCLNNNSSCNSAARFLHARKWCDLWFLRHASLQYFTRSQSVHSVNLSSSTSAMPQEAQHLEASASILLPLILNTTAPTKDNKGRIVSVSCTIFVHLWYCNLILPLPLLSLLIPHQRTGNWQQVAVASCNKQ